MESLAGEIWKAIPGFEGKYEVSDRGRVKSLDRIIRKANRWGKEIEFRWKGRILIPVPIEGYLQTKLGSFPRAWGIHQLVALAFHGPCPVGHVVDHVDTNKHNNTPGNLEYVTNPENVLRAHRTGLINNRGERSSTAKLTEADVRRILSFPKTMKHREIAAIVGCKPPVVQQILSGTTWRHISRVAT